jgi:hypothetical protein
MNTTPTKQLPSLEEFKLQAKELKKSENFEKLGHAQNALAKKYGYKDYRAIKSVLKSDDVQNNDMQSQILTASQFEQMIKEQIFSNNNPTVNFKKKHYLKNQKNIIDGIAIDPILPDDFWSTAHEDREKIELDEWWERPFIVTQGYDEESYEEYYSRMKPYYNELIAHYGEEKTTYKVETEDEFNARIAEQKKSWYEAWTTGMRYDVYILDGGAWDRPTAKGKVGSLEEALEIAKDLLS